MQLLENDRPIISQTAVEAGGRSFIVAAPRWTEWHAALDRASSDRQGQANPQLLLEECLMACVRTEGDRPIARKELQALAAKEGDNLLSAALAMISRQREALQLTVEQDGRGMAIHGIGTRLKLRPWTFGERNEALRRSLRLRDGKVMLDLGLYENIMIACSVMTEDGAIPNPKEWPVALGETVMRELDRLNGLDPDYTDTVAACMRSGIDHPDLAMIRLCRAFGWSPDQIELMTAQAGERLLAGMRVLEQQNPSQPEESGARDRADAGVTRILVRDE